MRVLALATMNHWCLKQLDVKNAFLHGHLDDLVFVSQPPGFVDPNFPNHVWHLKKALYGLRQAPWMWFNRLSSYLLHIGFTCSIADPSLFIYCHNGNVMLLLLYGDNIILMGNSSAMITTFLSHLSHDFNIKDLGELHFFLGVELQKTANGLFFN